MVVLLLVLGAMCAAGAVAHASAFADHRVSTERSARCTAAPSAYDMNGDTIWQDSEGVGHWESKDLEERCVPGNEDPGCRSHYGTMRHQ